MEIIHVIDEAKSPADGLIWTMWCGEQCVVDDDGKTTPELDFFLERETNNSTCAECLKKILSSANLKYVGESRD